MPAKKFGSQLDLQKIPVVGLVPESSATAPATPVAGQLWLDTSVTPNRLKVYENGAWVLASQTGTEQTVNKGAANGYASLDATTKVPIAQVPTGTTSTTVALGNDTRIVNAEQTTNKGVANGYAGLDATVRLATANLPTALTAAGLTGAAASSRYVGATASGAPTSGTFAVGDFVIDQTGNVWVCTVLGTPGTWVAVFRLGTTATTAAAGNDSRLSDQRVPTDNSVTGGTAGAGVKIQAGTITDVNVASANKDGAAGVTSMRTLGTGAQQAAAGTDSRFTDARTPTGAIASGDLAGSSYPNPTIAALAVTDAKVAAANKDGLTTVPSMRTLGTGAQQALAGNTRLDQLSSPTASVNLNAQKITGLGTPTLSTDAATKGYVDAARSGLDVKASVRAASTANVAGTYTAAAGAAGRGQLTAMPTTIDGVTLAVGDRVLLKNQTAGAQNGIWVVTTLGAGATGVWDRATDFDEDLEVTSGAFTFVEEGTVNDNQGWVLATNNPIVIGGASGTATTYAQFSGTGTLTAGNGLVQTGQAFDVNVDNSSLEIVTNQVRVKALGVTNAMLAGSIDLTTKVTGALPVTNGGTGSTTAAGARTAIAAVGKYAADLAALVAGTEQVITHNLNTLDVHAQFRTTADGYDAILSWRVISVNTIGVTADIAYTAAAVRAVVMG